MAGPRARMRMRVTERRGCIGLGIVVALLLGGLIYVHHSLSDGLLGWFFSLGFEEDTEYASRYSEQAFRAVRIGMMRHEVTDLLGPPLHVADLGAKGEMWSWSRSPGSKSYRVRSIRFRDGKVVAVYREFYVD